MFRNISRHKKRFLIVSDTAIFKLNGCYYAFGPVVRELDMYFNIFGKFIWIGYERNDLKNEPIMEKVPSYVKCILLPSIGGNHFINKLKVLLYVPFIAIKILFYILTANVIHTRAPSLPSFIALMFSFILRKKKWWHKYAGNWGQQNPPFFYGLQRKVLSLASHTIVTLNGNYKTKPMHCISFENPCITEDERVSGKLSLKLKDFSKPFNLCFVGRIEEEKGILRLIHALEKVDHNYLTELHIVGLGPLSACLPNLLLNLKINCIYHGSLNRGQLNDIFKKCHFIILPTLASEGFPKVLAEASNFGCIPIATNISAIGMYISDGINGFTLNEKIFYQNKLHERLLNCFNNEELSVIANNAYDSVNCFTFKSFNERLKAEVL